MKNRKMLWKGSRTVTFSTVSLCYHPFPWHQTRKATKLLKIRKSSDISLQCQSITVQNSLSKITQRLFRNEDVQWLPISRHCSTKVSSIVLEVKNSNWVPLKQYNSQLSTIYLTSQQWDGHFFPSPFKNKSILNLNTHQHVWYYHNNRREVAES